MKSEKNKVLGGSLLIAGSCIGAGMLALPILTGLAGLGPTCIMFFLAWGFMTTTALLLIEVNGWFKKPVNFLSMVEHTLGKWARRLSWILYLSLFYALIVAYMVLSGNHASEMFQTVFGITLPNWIGTFFFALIFGWLIYLGTRPVDLMNRLLMVGKIIAFTAFIILGLRFVKTENLSYSNASKVFATLPLLVISFGFHNMIPSLHAYLGGNTKKIKKSIIGGSLLTLGIYVIWVVVALGILSPSIVASSYANDIDAAQTIQTTLQRPFIGTFLGILAFFAILTSFLAQSLSLAHFWGDGLRHTKKIGKFLQNQENFWLCGLALLPPLGFAILFPRVFFAALDFGGGICAVTIFGLFPALMAWKGRKPTTKGYRVSGGKFTLVLVIGFALMILIYQLTQMLS